MAASFKIGMIDRCSPLEKRAAADPRGFRQFGVTRWLLTVATINVLCARGSEPCPISSSRNKREGKTSFPIAWGGTTPRLAYQGAIVCHAVDPT